MTKNLSEKATHSKLLFPFLLAQKVLREQRSESSSIDGNNLDDAEDNIRGYRLESNRRMEIDG
jgi:hypothetical protein